MLLWNNYLISEIKYGAEEKAKFASDHLTPVIDHFSSKVDNKAGRIKGRTNRLSCLLQAHCAPYTECTVYSGASTLNLSAIMPMTLILLMRYFT